ncbi:MAG TPA: reverse transcriptase/maturase family protein [Candidatus Paceibacterota bacterium]
MIKQLAKSYETIISLPNLLRAWERFLRGKKNKPDVTVFQLRLMDNLLALQQDLQEKIYVHGPYKQFNISDPKPRVIHKAGVRDRLLHHLLYQELYPYFDLKFIFDSYSCRLRKGTHRGISRFRSFGRIVSRNNTRTCWVLKCDIRKFFANIDHEVLKMILKKYIPDQDILWLLARVIDSFKTINSGIPKGLPLGNLTSQLLVNIYMNEFDRFAKNDLNVKYYVRYADDFVIFSNDRRYLQCLLEKIGEFLNKALKLELHPNKVEIRSLSSGVDFLGWVNFPHHSVIRTTTKLRMFKNLATSPPGEDNATLASYLGMLRWGNAHKIALQIKSNAIIKA